MDNHTGQRRAELRKAVIELRARGLNAPAKWAAEQLTGLPIDEGDEPKPSTSESTDEDEDDTYLLAKSFFDLKVVYHRAPKFSISTKPYKLIYFCRNIEELPTS